MSPAAVDEALAAIETVGRELNAFVEARPQAREEVAAATGSLAGMPIALKDMFVDEDRIPTCGSNVGAHWTSGTAAVVRRLRAAGAAIVGYSNLHEWGIGTTSATTATGPIRNPWSRDRIPGGSSGGSAAAVAAGVVRAAVGTDAGGSIRIPAACCEIVGFKPTWGRVPLEGFAEGEGGPPVDHVGPLARSVDDAHALFEVMADVTVGPVDVSRLRVGLVMPHFFDDVDPQIERAVFKGVSLLGPHVGSVIDVELKGAATAAHALPILLLSHTAALLANDVASRGGAFHPATLNLLQLGLATSQDDVDNAERMRVALGDAWDELFREVDVVVTPTIPAPPPAIDHLAVELPSGVTSAELAFISFNAPMNLGGVPALSLPVAEDDGGRAVNATITAARGRDDIVLSLGRALEDVTERRYVDRIATSGERSDAG
ncbi:MAG TPA: amidase [Actinomycetota bacterium]|nr:amidase [Actinomycetota bacterium]